MIPVVIIMASSLLVVPVGGMPLGGYIILPVQHQIKMLGKRLHHQKKLKTRNEGKNK